eukprot:scaffold114336_cov76-Cyclotella_meneghiniana.AAC.6
MRTLKQTQSRPAPSARKIAISSLSSKTDYDGRAIASSSSSVCSSGSQLPPSVLRKGKYTTDTSCNRPSIDLSIIRETYGKNASLYNVLHIKPSAEVGIIRKAYLKQGRKTLLEHGIAHKNGNGLCKFATPEAVPKKLEDVPLEARKKFQAISIAYEILSTPELRRVYDAKEFPDRHSTVDLKRVASGNSVKWNPYVEEKIILDSHPDEHSHHRKKGDGGWLQLHLQRLDHEAEMFLNGDFLDELDESITSMSESLSSIGSLMRKGIRDHANPKKCAKDKPAPTTASLKNTMFQPIDGKKQGPINVHTQFSAEIVDELNEPAKQTRNLESPCSVMALGEFVTEVMDEATSMLATSFSGLLDNPGEKKIEKPQPFFTSTTPRIENVRALERKQLEEKLREGFGEPFYSPPSPQKL